MTSARLSETQRLTLWPLSLGDVFALRALLVDPDVRRWLCDGRVLREVDVRRIVLDSTAEFRRSGGGLYGASLPGDRELVGFAGLKVASIGGLELVAALWPRHQRRGLATELCSAIARHAFDALHLDRLLACADAPNVASLRLITRLGFRQLTTTPGAFGAIRWFVLTPTSGEPA